MSNRSRMPASARKGVQPMGLAKVLTDAAARAQAKAAEINEAEDMEPDVDDLNILPMPDRQEIVPGKWMQWTWFVGPEVKVFGILYLKDWEDKQKHQYEVQLSFPGPPMSVFNLPDDMPKYIGQAMISAGNYQKIWKAHAGEFLERELLGDSEPEDLPPNHVEIMPPPYQQIIDGADGKEIPRDREDTTFDNG